MLLLALAPTGVSAQATQEPEFPVIPIPIVENVFQSAEGIAFNGEGELFVSAVSLGPDSARNSGIYKISLDGDTTKLAPLYRTLGVAAIGDRDVLVADFGRTNWFEGARPNRDGIVWRVTPEGEATIAAAGMGDPNFILVRPDGTFLVSDDATDDMFIVDDGLIAREYNRTINYPNGMAYSLDGTRIYVAQIFTSIPPAVFDGRVWALPIENGWPSGDPEVIVDLGAGAGNDGLAVDEFGRIYISAPVAGQVWRFDPRNGERVLIAENISGVASIAFGRGEFDHYSLYSVQLRRGNGKISRIPVGARGAPMNR